MDWLQSLDVAIFRFINQSLSNPAFDWVLPFFSWNSFFVPTLILLSAALICRGGRRGRLFLALLVLVIIVGDCLITRALKRGLGRPRPFVALGDIHVLIGKVASGSMPSGHAANWFAAATIAFVYYRRSIWLLLPLATIIGFSRVYLGVHYPSDVVVGAILGVSYAGGLAWSANILWRNVGRKWFPLWWARIPSLLSPEQPPVSGAPTSTAPETADTEAEENSQWRRLGYLTILALFVTRLIYLASGTIELSEDEAYQWLWSKHPALSYFSKPPLIAYTQWLGTTLWGDNAFGVRFFAPVIAGILSLAIFNFVAREVGVRAGFFLLLIITTIPMMAVGTILMTIDPLSVLFWTTAMVSGWKAVRMDSTQMWVWTGLWTGLGFLSKYTALFQIGCWAVYFILSPPARRQLRRPGPYLALLAVALCSLPVLIWNAQNGWITLNHLASRGGLHEAWRPTLRFFLDFVSAEALLLNPIFFLAAIWAALGFWLRRPRPELGIYLFSMGAPLFLFYFLYTFRARVQPNWIVPSLLPLFALMVVYWDVRWREGARFVKPWLTAGLACGFAAVVLLHETNLVRKMAGRPLPGDVDPLHRVRAWSDLAKVVADARTELQRDGKPVFVIGDHYGTTGLLSFYLPEAKSAVLQTPLVYYLSSAKPENQFYFWSGYSERKGQNAIFVQQKDTPAPPPERLVSEFGSVTDLGMREVLYRDQVFHRVQLFACRDLR